MSRIKEKLFTILYFLQPTYVGTYRKESLALTILIPEYVAYSVAYIRNTYITAGEHGACANKRKSKLLSIL